LGVGKGVNLSRHISGNFEMLEALNSKKLVGGIFCDLEKASDSVKHDILLCKLEFCGIRGL
jgi:hypothetical protein